MELAGFFVELGDGLGIEFATFGHVDEVGKVSQRDVCDGFSHVFEVDLGEELVEGVWKSETIGSHADDLCGLKDSRLWCGVVDGSDICVGC